MIPRQPGLFRLQHFHSLHKRGLGRYAAEVAEHFLRLDRKTLEQQNLSGESQRHTRDFPGAIPNIALFDQKMSALVEMAQNSPAEADFLEQRSINSCDAARRGVDQNKSLHAF